MFGENKGQIIHTNANDSRVTVNPIFTERSQKKDTKMEILNIAIGIIGLIVAIVGAYYGYLAIAN